MIHHHRTEVAMAIDFKTYSKLYANPDVVISDTMDMPNEYVSTVGRVIDDLKYRVDDFGDVTIEYIQYTLDSVDNIDKCLSFTKGDIPDGMMNNLSNGLYGKKFNDLDRSEKSIIITISAYICVAKNRMIVAK